MPGIGEIAEAFIRIRPKGGDDFANEAGKSIIPGVKRLATDAAGVFAATKIFDFAKAGFAELGEAQKVMAQTTTTIKSTGGAANVTAEQIGELADSLSGLSGKDDEAIQSGENLLLTFKNVRNEVGAGNDIFNRATAAALDLSVAFGQDMSSSAIQLGKALDNPIQGVTALQRVGVSFTAAQKETIKALVESGQTLEAQKIILAELESQVGGSAKAYGETLPGQVERAKTAFDNAKGAMVAGLAPALEKGASLVTLLSEKFSEQPEILQQVEGGLLIVGGGIASIARPINDVITLWRTWRTATEAATIATTELTVATEAQDAASVKGAGGLSNWSKAALVGTVAIAGLAVVATSLAADAAQDAADIQGFADAITETGSAAEGTRKRVKELLDSSPDLTKALVESGTSADLLSAGLRGTDEQFSNLVNVVKKGAEAAGIPTILLTARLAEMRKEALQGADVSKTAAALDELGTAAGGAAKTEEQLAEESKNLKDAQKTLADAIDGVASALDNAYGKTLDVTKLQVDYEANVDSLTESLAKNGDTLDGTTEKGRANIAVTLSTGEAISKLVEQRYKETGSLQEAQTVGAGYVANLTEQLTAAGLTEDQIGELIKTMKLTPEDIATTFSTNSPEVQAQVDELKSKITQVPTLWQSTFQALIDEGKYGEAKALLDHLADTRFVDFEAVVSTGGGRQARAAGGTVNAGNAYDIAEQGYEIGIFKNPGTMIAPSDGYILNHADSQRLVNSGGSSRGGTSTEVIQVVLPDVGVIAEAIRRRDKALTS